MKPRMRTLGMIAAVAISGGLLVHISQNVQQKEAELRRIEAAIATERESIIMLQAEWAALNSPTRLEELAQKHLNLGPVQAHNMMTDIPQAPAAVAAQQNEAVPPAVYTKASVSVPTAASEGTP